MKKIYKVIFIILCTLFFNVLGVQAGENDSNLKTEYVENVWSFHYRDGKVFTYGQLPFRYQNGKMAYCIDPSTPINVSTYSSYSDWSVTSYTEEIKKQMELIAHYGYGYPGHDTLKYYMATQELIWLFSDDEYIKWTVSNTSSSEEINVEKEKNEIMNLVNNHNKLPSFVGRCYTQNFGDKFNIVDKNNVIENYDIKTDLNYKINGSTITFTADKFGTINVELISKNSNISETIVYKSSSTRSQMMAIFGFDDEKTGSFSIKVDNVYTRIYKKDNDTKELITNKGTKFNIKDIDTNKYVVKDLEVNNKGYVDIKLPKGKYQIEEISASDGYVINKENKVVTIDEKVEIKNAMYSIDIYNSKPKGRIIIYKEDENKNHLKGVKIGIYDNEYKLIKELMTTDDEKLIVDDLQLGTYYVKEISTIDGYIIDKEYHKINLDYIDDKTYIVEKSINIINKQIKCDVVYITSNVDNELIKGIEINLYNESNEIIYNGMTDENGKIILEDLPYGEYYIKQVKVPSGYILNDKKVEFSVNDITCVADLKVINEKTIMPVTSSSSKNSFGFILTICLGVIFGIKKVI